MPLTDSEDLSHQILIPSDLFYVGTLAVLSILAPEYHGGFK
jgi:hypothetical protein